MAVIESKNGTKPGKTREGKLVLIASKSRDDASLLECAICLQQYNDPRVLACGHTFCLLCLKKHAAAVRQSSGVRLRCSLCNAPWIEPSVGGVDKLPSNAVLKFLLALKNFKTFFSLICVLRFYALIRLIDDR